LLIEILISSLSFWLKFLFCHELCLEGLYSEERAEGGGLYMEGSATAHPDSPRDSAQERGAICPHKNLGWVSPHVFWRRNLYPY
jgi:hypothetical protein